MVSTASLRLLAELDRSLVPDQGPSVRHLVLTLNAQAPAADKAAKQRPPLNLALVIDASGSMSGGRLDAARQAGIELIERLSERDTLSVVSFASDIITHVNALPLNGDNKRIAAGAIDMLTTRGSTNLAGGWQRGAECVAAHNKVQPGCHNRVLLLTDGHANEGIVDPMELGRQAEKLCGNGVSTSAVGIGDGYSSAQIESIAGNGGGQLHHAALPAEIVEVVMGELGDLAATVAENVTVEVDYPAGVKVEMYGDFPVMHQGHNLRATLGALIAARPRLAIFKLTTPAGDVGTQLPLGVRVHWNLTGTTEARTEGAAMALHFADAVANETQPRNVPASVAVARVWQAFALQRAVQLNREGACEAASQFLKTELDQLEQYCQGLPDVASLLTQMRATQVDIARVWDEGRRKEFANIQRKVTRQEAEHRQAHQRQN